MRAIGKQAFRNCTSLEKLNLPEGLTSARYNELTKRTSLEHTQSFGELEKLTIFCLC